MNGRANCNFFLLRYVPDAVKNEFVNIGLVLLPPAGAPEVRFTRDWARVKCLDSEADTELLESLEPDLRRQLQQADGDRGFILRRIQDSFSNTIQPSEFKACLAESPAREADALARIYLEPSRQRRPRELSVRQVIYDRMRRDFESAGAWRLMRRQIAVADYARTRDPLKIDCGYSNGGVKMFHALALSNDMTGVNAAKVLAFSFPQLAGGILSKENKPAQLTAVVEDDLDREQALVSYAFETLEQQSIAIAPLAQMANLAAQAAKDLGIA